MQHTEEYSRFFQMLASVISFKNALNSGSGIPNAIRVLGPALLGEVAIAQTRAL
jgi:hypothetical protein